jgi:Tfp pilus assembly protein PilV
MSVVLLSIGVFALIGMLISIRFSRNADDINMVFRCIRHDWSHDSADKLRCIVCNFCPSEDSR